MGDPSDQFKGLAYLFYLWFIIMTIMESCKHLLVKIVESSWDVNKVIKNM